MALGIDAVSPQPDGVLEVERVDGEIILVAATAIGPECQHQTGGSQRQPYPGEHHLPHIDHTDEATTVSHTLLTDCSSPQDILGDDQSQQKRTEPICSVEGEVNVVSKIQNSSSGKVLYCQH